MVCSFGRATSTWDKSWEENIEVTSRIKNPHHQRRWWQWPHFLHHSCNRFQSLENIFWRFSFGGEILDEQVDGCGRLDCWGIGQGRGSGFGVSDHLGMIVSLGFPRCLSGLAFIGAMTFLAAVEAEPLPHTLCTVGRGEFPEMDHIHIHGIGVIGRQGTGGEGGER